MQHDEPDAIDRLLADVRRVKPSAAYEPSMDGGWGPGLITGESIPTDAPALPKSREWSTGSVRDRAQGKGCYYLIPPEPMRRLALRYEGGLEHYGERNWEKGQPLCASYLDSAERHLQQLKAGDASEDHAAAVLWNLCGYIQTLAWIEEGLLPAELDDRPAWARWETT